MEELISAISGGLAAVCASAALYPLDVILVRYQLLHKEATVHGGSVVELITEALQGGRHKLYKGLEVKLLEALVKNFVYFYWYQFLKNLYTRKIGPITASTNICIACAAAALNQTMTAPFEVFTTNLQTSSASISGIAKNVYKRQGLRGFYRGFTASLVLCSNPAITNATFDRLKLALQLFIMQKRSKQLAIVEGTSRDPKLSELPLIFKSALSKQLFSTAALLAANGEIPEISSSHIFCFGALSKAIATLLTYPYIRAKVLLQKQKSSRGGTTMPVQNPCGSSQHSESDDTDSCKEVASGRGSFHDLTAGGEQRSVQSPVHNQPPSFDYQSESSSMKQGLPFNRGVAYLRESDDYSVGSFCVSDTDAMDTDRDNSGFEVAAASRSFRNVNREMSNGRVLDEYGGVINVLVSIVMQEGIAGMYKGLHLQLAKTVLASALLYAIKEKLQLGAARLIALFWICRQSRS